MGAESALAGLLISAGAGGVLGLTGANSRNKQAEKAKKSAEEAAALQKKQLAAKAGIDTEKEIRRAHAVRARALASAADSGFDVDSGDVDALLSAIEGDAELNLDIIRENLDNTNALVDSRLRAETTQIDAGEVNPFLSAFTGAMGGANTGLQLLNLSDEIDDRVRAETERDNAGNSVR